ncbi:MAG: hypothetical protein ACOCUW_01190 [Gemmatimonadota bacterium]
MTAPTPATPRGGAPGDVYCCECEAPRGRRRFYAVRDHGGAWSLTRYCDQCAALARVDWNGNTARLVGPLRPTHTGGNCWALAGTDPNTGEAVYITAPTTPTIPGPGRPWTLWLVPAAAADPEPVATGTMPPLIRCACGRRATVLDAVGVAHCAQCHTPADLLDLDPPTWWDATNNRTED